MEYRYPFLCPPITIGKTVFRHRMFSAPVGAAEITTDGCIGLTRPSWFGNRGRPGTITHAVYQGYHAALDI